MCVAFFFYPGAENKTHFLGEAQLCIWPLMEKPHQVQQNGHETVVG